MLGNVPEVYAGVRVECRPSDVKDERRPQIQYSGLLFERSHLLGDYHPGRQGNAMGAVCRKILKPARLLAELVYGRLLRSAPLF